MEGAEEFMAVASSERCMMMLWHNRLALVPFILSQFTENIKFAAMVSASRDGEILTFVARAYENGDTIRVPHHSRYQALQQIIRYLEDRKGVIVITPDGPRGPCYELKPGIAIAALSTQAHVIPLDWEAEKSWRLKTWDRMRFPKPFTTVKVKFLPSLSFRDMPQITLQEARELLAKILPTD